MTAHAAYYHPAPKVQISRKIIYSMIILVILAFAWTGQHLRRTPAPRPWYGSYSSRPMTNHAMTAHEGQDWNATTIRAHFDVACTPKIIPCPSRGFEIHLCQLNPDKSIALVIGRMGEIVTGFMASIEYWLTRCPAYDKRYRQDSFIH